MNVVLAGPSVRGSLLLSLTLQSGRGGLGTRAGDRYLPDDAYVLMIYVPNLDIVLCIWTFP